MEIIEEKNEINFWNILDLIKVEWPKEWKILSDEDLIQEFIKSSDNKFDVNKYLFENNQIIGWYRYSTWPREESNKTIAHVFDIVINPEYQGKGLGKLLMEDLIKDCTERGYEKIMSRTIEGNIQSYKLHEKIGFKISFRKGIDIVWEINI